MDFTPDISLLDNLKVLRLTVEVLRVTEQIHVYTNRHIKSQLKNKGTSPRYSETYAYKFYAVLLLFPIFFNYRKFARFFSNNYQINNGNLILKMHMYFYALSGLMTISSKPEVVKIIIF